MALKGKIRTIEEKNALKVPRGRPTLYEPKYVDMFLEYFNKPPTYEKEVDVVTKSGDVIKINKTFANTLPTIEGFAISIGISEDALADWAKQYPDFGGAFKRASQFQKHFLATNTLNGFYQPQFAKFLATNLTGWVDKKEIEHAGQIDSKVTVTKIDLDERTSALKGEKK